MLADGGGKVRDGLGDAGQRAVVTTPDRLGQTPHRAAGLIFAGEHIVGHGIPEGSDGVGDLRAPRCRWR